MLDIRVFFKFRHMYLNTYISTPNGKPHFFVIFLTKFVIIFLPSDLEVGIESQCQWMISFQYCHHHLPLLLCLHHLIPLLLFISRAIVLI